MQVISNGPIHVLSGSPADQARQLGRATRAEIATNVEIVRQERAKVIAAGISPERYDDALRRNEQFVHDTSPETLEEVRGLADGSGIGYDELLDLNLMTYFPLRRLHAECSQLYVGPPQTAGGERYLAKTRDMSVPSLLQTTIVRTYPDGQQIAEVIHSGAVTSPGSGLNSAGLTLSTSGVWARTSSYRMADAGTGWNLINPHLLLRQASSVAEVAELLAATRRNCGLNIIAADEGAAATFEVTPTQVVVTPDTDGRLILTNHYPSAELQAESPQPSEYASTFDRAALLRRFDGGSGPIDATAMWAAMTSHDGYPQSGICRHATEDLVDPSITAYASVADLSSQTFMVAMGQPCEAKLTFRTAEIAVPVTSSR